MTNNSEENILSEKKFIQIIKDVHLIEAKYETIKFKNDRVIAFLGLRDFFSLCSS